MNERIEKLAKKALAGYDFPQCVSYTSEDSQNPIKIGTSIREYLKIQPYELRENEFLCDRYSFAGLKNAPSCYYRSIFGNRGRYWKSLCVYKPTNLFYWGWTHIALDFEYVLNNGFEAYYERIKKSKENHINDKDKMEFLDGMKLCLDGIIARYRAYGEMASELARDEQNEYRKNALLKLADTFTRIPLKPANSFFDAVQFVWICFLLAPDSLGRIDQYLLPYYRNDLKNSVITETSAFELLEELFIKVYETQSNNFGLGGYSGHNHLVVGGYLTDGTDGFNELSKLILEAIVDLPTYRPQASFRYTKYTTAETMRFITEMNKKSQLIVFVNDEPRIDGMVACGIDREDAINYSVIGCNEWAIVGKSKIDLAHINLVHSIEQTIYENKAPETYEKFYKLYEKELKKDITAIVNEYTNYAKAQSDDNNVLTSIFHDDCIENATSMSRGGTKYYGLTMSFNSISNVADSLSVIKQFVYDEKLFSFEELLTALKNNWQGYEDMRNVILKDGHFFGNDDDYVDDIAKEIVNSIYAIKEQMENPYIKNLIVGSFVGATHPNIVMGKLTKATPDGRFDGEEFTMGISQSQGKDKNGITALLKSIAKLDYSKFCGCIVSNLKMDKSMADTPEKLDRLASVYHTFLKLGGMQLQINYLSTEELIEAQKTPEKYSNLLVRVTGYSGFFTRFDVDLQNDIIKRTSQGCLGEEK